MPWEGKAGKDGGTTQVTRDLRVPSPGPSLDQAGEGHVRSSGAADCQDLVTGWEGWPQARGVTAASQGLTGDGWQL